MARITKHTTRTLRKSTGGETPRQQHRATKTKATRTGTSTGTIVTVGGVLFLLLQQWRQIQRNSGTFHDVREYGNALSFGGGEIMTPIDDHQGTQIEAYGGGGEDNQQQQQQQRRLYYIHVGKTGGSTMDKVLRSNCEWYRSLAPKKKCFRELSSSSSQATAEGGGGEEEESVLSKATTRTLHLNVRNKIEGKFIRNNNITSFLWTLRNPISRAVSAFNMDHPDNSKVSGYQGYWGYWRGMFYRDCGFRTVQDFADILMLLPLQQQQQQQQDGGGGTPTRTVFRNVTGFQSNKTDVVNCRELAEKVIAGQAHVLINSHLSSNYATYAAATIQPFPHKEILVVRTEELWNDVANLDHLLSVSSWSGNQSHSYGDSSNSSSGRKNSVQAVIATAASRNTNSNTTTTTSTSASIQKNAMANYRHSHGSESYKVKSDLTAQGKAVLCCFLSNENQIYEDLMRRAINLSWEEKNKYVNILYNDCRIGSNTSQILHNNNGSSNSNGDDNQSFNWVDWRSAGCPTIN